MSEQQEPNITDPREAKAELLRWLDAGGFADYGFAVATVRRIIAERDAARAEAEAYRPILKSIRVYDTSAGGDYLKLKATVHEAVWYAAIDASQARQALNGGPNAN